MFTLDISNDYKWIANRETITLLDTNGSTIVAVADSKRLMQNQAEREPSLGHYTEVSVDFRLPSPITDGFHLSPIDVIPGMFVVDGDSVQYVVLAVDPPSTYGDVWKCNCMMLLATHDTISILIASCDGSSATGARPVTWTPIVTNYPSAGGTTMPAAIQPRTQGVDDPQFGTLTSPEVWDIYLSLTVAASGDPSVIKAGSLVQDQNGVQYEIMEVLDRDRLDRQTHLVCIRKLT